MRRANWKTISLVAAVLAAVAAVAVYFAWGPLTRPRTMGGVLAVGPGESPKHGFLGIGFTGTTAPLTIRNVIAGTTAEEAGLQPGDIIVSAGAVDRPDLPTIQRGVEQHAPGDVLAVTVQRGGELKTVQVRLMSFTELMRLRQGLGPIPVDRWPPYPPAEYRQLSCPGVYELCSRRTTSPAWPRRRRRAATA